MLAELPCNKGRVRSSGKSMKLTFIQISIYTVLEARTINY